MAPPHTAAEGQLAVGPPESPQAPAHVSVRHVLVQRRSGVASTFRLLVRLCAFIPTDPANFCFRPRSQNQQQPESLHHWTFAAKLLLKDATGELDATLCGRAGQQLFGFAACDLRAQPARRQVVADFLSRATEVHLPQRLVQAYGTD